MAIYRQIADQNQMINQTRSITRSPNLGECMQMKSLMISLLQELIAHRTPESTLGTQIRKVQNFQNFIWTVLANLYLDGRSGFRCVQFLSGHRSGLPKTSIFAFFTLKHQFFAQWLLRNPSRHPTESHRLRFH